MIILRHRRWRNAARWRTCVRSLRRIGSPCRTGGETYYPLTDVQGTIWGYVDANNSIVAQFEYDAWGNILSATSSVPALAVNRYRFQCREWSAATGLVNFRARWYDPVTGRWLSKDPIGLNGGLNLYVFCGNDPVNSLDPFGTSLKGAIETGILAHWGRNKGLNGPSNVPSTKKEAEEQGWEALPPSESVYHSQNGANNSKFISPDGHREAVYNSVGNLVTDPVNQGTYNIYNPKTNPIKHGLYDVVPYLILGNSPDDAFSYGDRISATIKSIRLKLRGK